MGLPDDFSVYINYPLLVQGISILQASLSSTSALTAGLSHLLTKIKEENWVINDIVMFLDGFYYVFESKKAV